MILTSYATDKTFVITDFHVLRPRHAVYSSKDLTLDDGKRGLLDEYVSSNVTFEEAKTFAQRLTQFEYVGASPHYWGVSIPVNNTLDQARGEMEIFKNLRQIYNPAPKGALEREFEAFLNSYKKFESFKILANAEWLSKCLESNNPHFMDVMVTDPSITSLDNVIYPPANCSPLFKLWWDSSYWVRSSACDHMWARRLKFEGHDCVYSPNIKVDIAWVSGHNVAYESFNVVTNLMSSTIQHNLSNNTLTPFCVFLEFLNGGSYNELTLFAKTFEDAAFSIEMNVMPYIRDMIEDMKKNLLIP